MVRISRPGMCEQVLQRLVQQPTGAGRSGVGDQESDVKVVGRGQESRGPGRVAEVDGHGPVADAVGVGHGLAQGVERVGRAGGEDEIQARRRADPTESQFRRHLVDQLLRGVMTG
jgi:hypothetical protein